MLYPLQFTPILKDRLWGGTKLQTQFNKPTKGDTVGESWEVSTVPGDISKVANGFLQGKSLQEVINTYKEEFLGKQVVERFGLTFPILIKFIDAKLDLSIQVHPNDALAKERHNSFGKTEMWYIMQADDDANLIVGFNKEMNREEYSRHLENGTLTDIMNYEKVQEGDTFFINTGTVHAIGGGIVLAEIQQTSDITYRVFDFNRKDKSGNLRELHTEQALDAIDYSYNRNFEVNYNKTENEVNTMVNSPYFITNFIPLNGKIEIDNTGRDSFTIFMCVEGQVVVGNEVEEITLYKGQTVVMPAVSKRLTLNAKKAKLLEVYI